MDIGFSHDVSDRLRLASARNLSAALFRLEASRGAEEAIAIVRALVDWLKGPEQSS